MKQRSFLVSDVEAGTRLDIFLVRHLAAESRTVVQKQIERGDVLVNGNRTRPGHKLCAGDTVDTALREIRTETESIEPWPQRLEILYEDSSSLQSTNQPGSSLIRAQDGAMRRWPMLSSFKDPKSKTWGILFARESYTGSIRKHPV